MLVLEERESSYEAVPLLIFLIKAQWNQQGY